MDDVDPPQQHTVTGWAGTSRPAHAARNRRPPGRLTTAVGVGLMLLGLGVAAVSCLGSLETKSTPTSASLITVAPTAETPSLP